MVVGPLGLPRVRTFKSAPTRSVLPLVVKADGVQFAVGLRQKITLESGTAAARAYALTSADGIH